MKPPLAKQKDTALTTHGHTRIDPYFWMRLTDQQKNDKNPDSQTKEVRNYLNAENDYTRTKLMHTEKLQGKIYSEIVDRIKKDDQSIPYKKNGYLYYTRYEKGKEYPIHCRKKDNLNNPDEIILNVNELAKGHEYYAATGLSVSPDNKTLAFAEDAVSRRIYTIKFKNLQTGEVFGKAITQTSGYGVWGNDSKTYFYTTKNKTTLLTESIKRHKLNSTTEEDVTVYTEPDPAFYIGVGKTKSDRYIIIQCSSTLSDDRLLLNADTPEGTFKRFTPRVVGLEYEVAHFKDKFYVLTNWKAENFRLMETSLAQTDKKFWVEKIPHNKDVLLEGIDVFEKYLVISQRSHGLSQIKVIDQAHKTSYFIDAEDPAYFMSPTTNLDFNTSTLRYIYTSMTTPNSVYDFDMATQKKVLRKRTEVVGGHKPEDYVSERIMVPSRDGKAIPVSLVYKKDAKKDSTAPFLLYGYGAYGATMDPYFSIARLSLLDRGFTFAIAHIRGGEDLGRRWYLDGKMNHKKNTFFDFIDCAQYFIDTKRTSSDHLYGMGGSAGGLLIGAVANMAPNVFKGLIAAVPFVDVVSTMLDESIPLTTNEFDEWGNPKDKKSYDYMLSYSPYDNVVSQEYPNMLVTTGFFDSQVQYWEPAKWVAKLRSQKTGNQMLLLQTNMSTGHGGASGRLGRYKETALEYAFLIDLENDSKHKN